MSKPVKFNMGNISVEGVPGYFSQTRVGAFARIKHVTTNDFKFVGSVPLGVYGEPGQFPAKGNDQFGKMVEDKISQYIERNNL